MRTRLVTVVTFLAVAAQAHISQSQPPRGPGGPGRGQMLGVGALLFSEEVRGEIDLLEEQEADLRQMGEEVRDKMRRIFSGMRDLSPEERRAAFEDARESMQAVRDEVNERVKQVLMPHQWDRLRQIELQQQMRRQGAESLGSGRIAEALGLTEEQKLELQRRAAEQTAKLEERIRQLREEAQDEVLKVLTAEQRAKFDELMGKPFELQGRPDGSGFRDPGRRGPRGPGELGRRRFGGRRGGDRGADRPELE